ncbi:MAG TPA: DUF6089 family protein [Cytophagaceae bacterium]|jgi:hypothetical protein
MSLRNSPSSKLFQDSALAQRFKKIICNSLLIAFFVFAALEGKSQAFNKKNRYGSYGFSLGAMNYIGELDPNPNILSPGLKFTRYNIGFSMSERLFPRFTGRGNVSYGRIIADDYENASYNEKNNIYRKIRNLSFRSYVFELKGDIVIDLFENRQNFRKRPDYVPYVFIGLAFFRFDPKANHNGEWVALQPIQTEGKKYSLNQVAVPFGIGFRYKIGKSWDLAFEMGWRYTLTDYLDDVSTSYIDKTTLGTPGTAGYDLADRSLESYSRDPIIQKFVDEKQGGLVKDAEGRVSSVNGFGNKGDQRGDPNRDWYVVTGFHLTHILPGRVICPKFR